MVTYPLSRHAQMRRKQMGVTEHRIEAVLGEPETIYPGDLGCHPKGRTCYQRGELVVIVDNRRGQVVTVLWHRKEGR
jgi:hypothetical protein